MILHGDSRGKKSRLNSIEKYDKMNQEFDFVITNPPFGNRDFLVQYYLDISEARMNKEKLRFDINFTNNQTTNS